MVSKNGYTFGEYDDAYVDNPCCGPQWAQAHLTVDGLGLPVGGVETVVEDAKEAGRSLMDRLKQKERE